MAPPATTYITTSFLLSNLHCPSCVSTIKSSLQEACGEDIIWVSPNVVTSVVTVEHKNTPTASATIREMAKSLEEAGFELCGVTTTAVTADKDDLERVAQIEFGESSDAIAQGDGAIDRWLRIPGFKRSPATPSGHKKAHLENCEQCRSLQPSHGHLATSSSADPILSNSGGQSSSSVERSATPDAATGQIWRASLSVGGMTCAACVNTIADELNKREWISSVAVNLVTNSAAIDYTIEGKEREIVETIEDLGYEATLNDVINVGQADIDEKTTVWRASLAVGGMTCASCSNTITQELNKRSWITNVAVNLVANSATVDFTDASKADAIVEAIEDLGFEATMDAVSSLKTEKRGQQERTVQILVDGLFCQHCPERLSHSLAGFRRQVEVIAKPTVERPLVKIRYVPEAPFFTIRHILCAIEAADPSFHASIYHPPSLEERSKLITAKHQRQLTRRVALTFVIAIPTFILGIVYMSLLPMGNHGRHYLMSPWTSGLSRAQIALFILATPVYFFAADIFHTRALKEVRSLWRRGSRTPILQRFYKFGSMNMLMSLGTTIAYISSVSQMISAAVNKPDEVEDTHFYFDSVVFLTMFLLLGRLIESYSKSKTGDAVEQLGKLRPTTTILVEKDKSEKTFDTVVNVDKLEFGDIIRVPHGASPAADGTVVQGESSFDESSLTGESRLIKKTPGDEVFAGTVNKDAAILVRITGVAGQSMLDQIVKIVREGQTRRAPMERIADMLTAYFVPIITLIAIITWVVWMVLGYTKTIPGHFLDTTSGWVAFALQFAIAVFVVACPCGLALAAPTAIFVGGGLAAKHGILAKGGGEAFEKASKVDCVVFDKTGTLTIGGEPKITDAALYPNKENASDTEVNTLLATMRAVEENSSHPIAKAIVSYCVSRTDERAEIDGLQELPGKGMMATYRADTPETSFDIIVGNEPLMHDYSVDISENVSAQLQTWKSEAKSVALIATKRNTATSNAPWIVEAALSISDPIRPEAVSVVRALQDRGTRVWMLSGDNVITAKAVARLVGIDPSNVLAEVLPSQKAERITYLQGSLKARVGRTGESSTKRATIAMVGDGINDSPALTTADVGIAIGSGSDVAISSAGFVLLTSDLKAVVTLLELSRVVFRRIKFNFGWALVYNVLAVPIAAGCLFPIMSNGTHVRLDPVWASLAMALSSISVVLSSLALRTRIPGIGFRKGRIDG